MCCASRLSRRFVLLVSFAGLGAPLSAAFEVNGEFPDGFADATVTVSREWIEERSLEPVGSTRLVGGRFQLQVDAEGGLFTVQVGDTQTSIVARRGESLRIEPAGDGKGLRVRGGTDQTLYEAYEALRATSLARHVLSVREEIRRSRAAGDAAAVERLTEDEITGYRDHRRELNDFTLERLRGSLALYPASLRWDGDHRLDELAEVVGAFAAKHPGMEVARRMEARIDRFRATAIGAMAPGLEGPAPDGRVVSLAAHRGKVVLVDFWAAWCPPCRIENRHYRVLYERYRDRGFEIVAVSVDHSGSAWRAAIAEDNAGWVHLSDLSGWKTPLAARYNVTALPASFLLDGDGRIIGKDLRGPQLAEILESRLLPAGRVEREGVTSAVP